MIFIDNDEIIPIMENLLYRTCFKLEMDTLTDDRDRLDRFYTSLNFGTGGLRGLMGVGANRMNIYTVRQATQHKVL